MYSNMHRRGLAEGRRADGTAVYVPTLAEAERDDREVGLRRVLGPLPSEVNPRDFAPNTDWADGYDAGLSGPFDALRWTRSRSYRDGYRIGENNR